MDAPVRVHGTGSGRRGPVHGDGGGRPGFRGRPDCGAQDLRDTRNGAPHVDAGRPVDPRQRQARVEGRRRQRIDRSRPVGVLPGGPDLPGGPAIHVGPAGSDFLRPLPGRPHGNGLVGNRHRPDGNPGHLAVAMERGSGTVVVVQPGIAAHRDRRPRLCDDQCRSGRLPDGRPGGAPLELPI